MIFSLAHAQDAAGAAQQGGGLVGILPFVIIVAVFYLLIIRPQNKKIKEHQALVNSLARGDEVITGGGLYGKVTKIEDEKGLVFVEIAPNVVVKVNRGTISERLNTKDEASQKKSGNVSKNPRKKSTS